MNKNKNPLLPLVAVSFVAFVLLLLILPYSLSARTTTRSFPDIPWNGMKINVTANGNFVFGGKQDHASGGGGTIAAYRAQENYLCSDGVINTINLSGNTLTAYNGDPLDFFYIQRDISIFYYLAGSNEPTTVQNTSQKSTTLPSPTGLDWPFNITVPLPSTVDIGFQIILQVCAWGDPGHTYTSCKILNYDATTIDHLSGPDLCFQVEQIAPADQSKNVDFDQPAITATFTTPFDPDSINKDTFRVFYWDIDGDKAYVDGSYEFSDDKKVATLMPSGGLLDGVYYVAEIWGETNAQALNHAAWVKGANGGSLKQGKIWSFWTMPDLTDKIVVVPVQSVEGAALIKDKPTAVRVFLRWDYKPQVSPNWQLKTLDANIKLSWWENLNGHFDSWEDTGRGSTWTPKFETPIKREYLIFTQENESYSKKDKILGLESVTYYGYTPRQIGSVSFKAEVEPTGQTAFKPRSFLSNETSLAVRDSKKFRYAFIPINVGNWASTGLITSCPSGIAGSCANIQAMADQNHTFLRSLFPLPPGHAVRNRNLSQARLITPPASLGTFHPIQGTDSNQSELLYWLSRRAQTSNSWDVFVGVVPRDWLGACGNTYAESWFGLDFARYSLLMGQNVPMEILSHELGHILRDWKDYGPNVLAGEGFPVDRKRPWSNNAFSMAGKPDRGPIKNLMYKDVCGEGYYWLDLNHYAQLYQNELAPLSTEILQAGEPLLLAAGTINLTTNLVTRDPWYILEPGSWRTPTTGEFDLVLLDSGGSVLGNHSFATMAPGDGLSRFLLKVPYPAGMARIQIKRQGTVIQELSPSSQAPQLTITSPTAEQTWSGTRNVTWTASDGNGDPLYFTLYLSSNGGTDWEPLEMDLQTNSYTLDTRTIAGCSNCYLKIAASDGLLTTIQTVGPFTIQNQSQVAGFSPQAGDTNVSVTGPVRVEFSEGINPATLTAGAFYLQNAQNQTVPGAISYDAPTSQAFFTPDSPLNYATTYTAKVANGVLTSGGTPPEGLPLTWSFTTEANIYPPQVVRFSPGAGEDKVSLNAALVTVRFDQPMNPASLTAASFSVTAKNGSSVAGQITYNSSTQTALFRPGVNLTADTQYVVTLTSAVEDAQGNTLTAPFSWAFKTGSENTPWVRLIRHFKDYLWDQNGDGVWDTLVIEVEIAVLFTSTYHLSGWLLDKNGQAVARATTGNVALSGGVHLLSLYFSRQDIQNHGGEGPYYFADAVLYDVQYPSGGDSLTDPYTIGFSNYTRDADLLLFATPDPGVFNQPLTLYASVANQGASNADGVVLTVTLPASVDFISVATGKGSCSHNGSVVTCSIGTLASFQSNLVPVVVTPKEKGWILFNASVTSVQDSYVANNDRQLSLEIGSGNNILYLPLILNQ